MQPYNTIKVIFLEKKRGESTTRFCYNMTKEQIIKQYGLNEPDIEWYEMYSNGVRI